MKTARQPDDDDRSVYDKAVQLVAEGSIAAIIPVETETHEGLFAVAHSFEGAPYLKASCFHRSPRRRALAAFLMVRFARQIAVEEDFTPIP